MYLACDGRRGDPNEYCGVTLSVAGLVESSPQCLTNAEAKHCTLDDRKDAVFLGSGFCFVVNEDRQHFRKTSGVTSRTVHLPFPDTHPFFDFICN